jgi:hypothetical protein
MPFTHSRFLSFSFALDIYKFFACKKKEIFFCVFSFISDSTDVVFIILPSLFYTSSRVTVVGCVFVTTLYKKNVFVEKKKLTTKQRRCCSSQKRKENVKSTQMLECTCLLP